MKDNYSKFIDIFGRNKVLINEPLSKYTSLKLGGPADLMVRAIMISDLVKAVRLARKFRLPYFLLGQGSNILVSDRGFRGLIIKNESGGIKLKAIKGAKENKEGSKAQLVKTVFLEAESGVLVNRLVRYALDQGFSGLQYFLGQPGTVGGAVYINVHNMRMGKFFGDLIYQAKILNQSSDIEVVPMSYLDFGYDRSIIQKSKDIVLSVVMKLATDDKTILWKEAEEVREYRGKTHPAGYYSCGCVFRNIEKSDAMRIATPGYTVSAGYLIDSLKLKGMNIGGIQISPVHANFMVHRGEGKASDMIKLINLVKQKVKEKYFIDLKTEIVTLGDFS